MALHPISISIAVVPWSTTRLTWPQKTKRGLVRFQRPVKSVCWSFKLTNKKIWSLWHLLLESTILHSPLIDRYKTSHALSFSQLKITTMLLFAWHIFFPWLFFLDLFLLFMDKQGRQFGNFIAIYSNLDFQIWIWRFKILFSD